MTKKYARMLPMTSIDCNITRISNSHHAIFKIIFINPSPHLFPVSDASSVNYHILKWVCRLYFCTKMIKNTSTQL